MQSNGNIFKMASAKELPLRPVDDTHNKRQASINNHVDSLRSVINKREPEIPVEQRELP